MNQFNEQMNQGMPMQMPNQMMSMPPQMQQFAFNMPQMPPMSPLPMMNNQINPFGMPMFTQQGQMGGNMMGGMPMNGMVAPGNMPPMMPQDMNQMSLEQMQGQQMEQQQAAPTDDSFVQSRDEVNMGALPKKLVELERKNMMKSGHKLKGSKSKRAHRPPDSTNLQEKSEFWGFPPMNPFAFMASPFMPPQYGMMNPWMQPNMYGGQFMMPNQMIANPMMHHQQ